MEGTRAPMMSCGSRQMSWRYWLKCQCRQHIGVLLRRPNKVQPPEPAAKLR